ncbi:NAD-dependent epimerase/dehydratase family protein [Marivita sp.]|uniref:NAD-dependent epimerase/dehydratase family protein n=1 Tax=Marivita sp. TaxID=2003365 RepID=UPI003F6B92B3
MGDVKRVLITGASGFIGHATVAAAVKAGLEVVAVQRSKHSDCADITIVSTDLTEPETVPVLIEALVECDAVIHLAAAMSGDPEDHERLTVGGTQHLVEAMAQAGTTHLTIASSIAVFDTRQIAVGGTLTDNCPLVSPEGARDAYSAAKVRQEQIAKSGGFASLAIRRPGIVYDDEHLWNAHLGIGLGPVLLRFKSDDRLPMCHVDRCAAALVQTVLHKVDDTFTILDPDLPTRQEVITALRQTGWPKNVAPIPWRALWLASRLLRPLSAKLPGLLREDVLRQRGLPLVYKMNDPIGASDLPDLAPNWRSVT